MTKKKISSEQIVFYLLVFVGVIALGIFADNKKEEYKIKEIEAGNYKVYGMVEKLKPHSRKGRRYSSRKDILYLFYEKNDTIFHLIEDLSDGQIEKLGIKINDCFEVKIAESDRRVFKIDFNKKMDTLIDKEDFKHQIYLTARHKKLLE